MNKHNIMGLIMPTIEPYTLRKYWLPSLRNIKDIAPYANICINFQDTYIKSDVESIIE